MRYECCPNDPDHFATALRRDVHTRKLTWDNAQGQDVIIVQTAFGVSASAILDEICEALNRNERPLTDYVEVMDKTWVRYVTAADKARNSGCHLNGEASTYTVFSCQKEGDLCKIYRPKNQAMISQSCSIPLEIQATVQKVTRLEGLLRRREVDTGFYMISFPSTLAEKYFNGSLYYRVNGLEIPVTRQMVKQGSIFIKTTVKPELLPTNKGIRIV